MIFLSRPENILNDKSKILRTPYAEYLQLGASKEKIETIKAMYDGEAIFESAFELFRDAKKFDQIGFGVESLDRLTGGGIDVGSVTEVFGDAGSGKTQLCLQLAINCAANLNGITLYCSTDKSFPSQRLSQMAESQRSKEILDEVYVWEIRDVEKLKDFMRKDLPRAVALWPNVKLIVIDSIAGIFRHETDYIQRARDMREFIEELTRQANEHNFAIVCTNHMTAKTGFSEEVAALGPSWEKLVTSKLKVTKTDRMLETSGDDIIRLRTLEVIHSPRLPPSKGNFAINSSGAVDIEISRDL